MSTADSTVQPRLLAPTELAGVVKLLREVRKWSQEQLAEISKLSARTVQRVEEGSPSSVDTRRALASAFGLEDIDVFNKPYAIPTPEQAQAALEKFEKEHITLKAEPLQTGKQLAKLAERANADMFSSSFDLPREAEEAFAALTDYFREYRDCSDLYSEVDKLTVHDELQEHITALSSLGVSLCSAMRTAKLRAQGSMNGTDISILYVVAFPKGQEPEQFVVARAVNF